MWKYSEVFITSPHIPNELMMWCYVHFLKRIKVLNNTFQVMFCYSISKLTCFSQSSKTFLKTTTTEVSPTGWQIVLFSHSSLLCQQVFRKHTDSSHSNSIDETYWSCCSRPQDVTVQTVSCKATCYLYFSLLNLTISFSTLLEAL